MTENTTGKVVMLLDPDKWDGKHEKRSSPYLKTLAFIAVPFLPVLNICLILVKVYPPLIVIVLSVTLYLYYIWRVIAIIILREGERLKKFRKQLYSKYEEPADLSNIVDTHDVGCVEYIDGTGCYMVMAHFGEKPDPRLKAYQISKFLNTLKGFNVDQRIFNDVDSTLLDSRYKDIGKFPDKDTGLLYRNIIEHNKEFISNHSLVITIVFIVRGPFYEKKRMLETLRLAVKEFTSEVFKEAYICNQEEVEAVIRRDTTTYLDLSEMLQQRYGKGEYYSSRVLGYDSVADGIVKEEIEKISKRSGLIDFNSKGEERGFMIKHEN